ncbi:MAG: glycine zipper 2TM domain-containing protein [Limnobacter sp.]|nr:glycine zipper 2TM domain-containing protein [Limnobacter sp.]
MNTQKFTVARIKSSVLVISMAAVTVLSGCAAQSTSGSVYRESDTRRAQIIEQGTVESVRIVTIQAESNGVGPLAGGVIGGIAGSGVGGGRGQAVGAVLGAVLGGVAGQRIEENAGTRPGLEITVKLDNGTLRAYVQEGDEQFRAGDRVRITTSGGYSRVSRG